MPVALRLRNPALGNISDATTDTHMARFFKKVGEWISVIKLLKSPIGYCE